MNLQNTAGKSLSTKSGDFVVFRPLQRIRFSQYFVCNLLAFAEALFVGVVAGLLMRYPSFGNGDIRYAISSAVAITATVLFVVFVSGGANFDRFASRISTLGAGLAAAILTAAAVAINGGATRFTLLAALLLLVSAFAAKMLTKRLVSWLEVRGHLSRLIAVAADDLAQRAAMIRLFSIRDDIEIVFSGSPCQFDILSELTQNNQLDEIVLSGHQANEENIAALAGLAVTLVRVTPQDVVALTSFDLAWGKKRVFGAWSAPASIIALPPLRGWQGIAKRAIDIMGSMVGLVLLSPILLVCAVAIKLDSNGPVLFVQERAGYRNKSFRMYKFRSMSTALTDFTGSQLTLRNDPRVTRVGAALRRTSLDELPQLLNVLKGNMSLVGPRPHPKGAKAGKILYDDLIPNFYSRYRMKPGITGLAQISGLRGNTETEKHLVNRFRRDMQYAAEWTPLLDLAIILRTISHVIKGTNAF